MTTDALIHRRLAAETMARALGTLAMGYFNDPTSLGVTMKGRQDFLTIADGAVETRFREMVAEAFPKDGVMGEEQGGGDAAALWIIDPIDGTANFARGDRMWCVSIGFLLNGVPEIGVIHAPALDETYVAWRGGGAYLNGKPIRAAGTSEIGRASVEVGWSTRRPVEDYLAIVGRFYHAGAGVKRCASGALGLAHVANGRTDGYAELHINSWDVAAGVVIASEAGAVVNAYFSGDWAAGGNPILAAAPGVAAEVSRLSGIAI